MSRMERDCLRVLQVSAPQLLSAIIRECRPWASALFVGNRLTVAVEGADDIRLDDWLAALPQADLAWPGHFVASAEVVERSDRAATIELLVVEA